MLTESARTPWHRAIQLREDIRTGELSLASFAADLYQVAMQTGERPAYEDPAQFFALTYPTYNLRELTRDVALRLAGKSTKAIRQLELTYGGGKTHTLITLYHLVSDPASLPDLPAVHEFVQHIGFTPPQTRVVLLAFDKLDVEKGMEVRGAQGQRRWLQQPWSVIAYQIAGDDGLRMLHAEGQAEERASAPAENLLVDLLRLPQAEGMSTLILIDEVLMYAREKVGLDPVWRGRLLNFFQYLTQAVTRVDRCAVVASLLATDPRKRDQLGKELTQELYAILRREKEEGVQPVLKEDVSEVLRRRFFTPGSIQNREAFRPHVMAALQGITALDEQTDKEGKSAEERFFQSYPFHPDLTDTFYTKWTNLEGFQRTRGILRTFALALRDAEEWDTAPLIGCNVFLPAPGEEILSEAARELTSIAETEEYEGRRHEWSAILLGELAKARGIQQQYPHLVHREVEQAVFGTFLHSQPVGQKALTRDLMLLLGATRPDKIELAKALHRWVEVSWFLDEDVTQDSDDQPGEAALPRAWRLGSRPNLTQMHADACANRVQAELVDSALREAIAELSSLTDGAKGPGARVHNMPNSPSQVGDEGDFHYVILPPEAACDAGHPSDFARRFWSETTTPQKPRVNRNALVLVAPSRAGLDQAQQAVLVHLGWQEVQGELKKQQPNLADVDPLRWQTLLGKLKTAKGRIPNAIREAYTTVITMSANGEIDAFRVTVESDPLFSVIKASPAARIQETAVSAEALLPEGPYELWQAGETSRWLKDLVDAFAQYPRLPKMLNRQAVLDTLVNGCKAGLFVFRIRRPDGSMRTFWHDQPDDKLLKESRLEVVLPEAATLSDIGSSLLVQGKLPGLWEKDELTVQAVYDYFAGGHVVMVQKEGYEEPVMIPAAPQDVVDTAIKEAVERGLLWLVSGPSSIWSEPVPAGILGPKARLLPPPAPVTAQDIVPANLPDAWPGETTTALAIATALATARNETLPWPLVQTAIDDAFQAHYLTLAEGSGPWPCAYHSAQAVKLQLPSTPPIIPPKPKVGTRVAEATLEIGELQELADRIGDVAHAAGGHPLTITVRLEVGDEPSQDTVDAMGKVLSEVSTKLTFK